jgi:pyruvate phosphate dikinase-like enzyme
MEINARDCGLVSIIVSTRGLGMSINDHVRWFSDIRVGDVALVGGKNASLGELYSTLSKECVRVPNGFALTADAYRDALTVAKAWERLHALLDDLASGRSPYSPSVIGRRSRL